MGEKEEYKWSGVANGPNFTIAQKAELRGGEDMPEDNQAQFVALLDVPPEVLGGIWRTGLIDLCTLANGKGAASMTVEQSEHWKQARGY